MLKVSALLNIPLTVTIINPSGSSQKTSDFCTTTALNIYLDAPRAIILSDFLVLFLLL